MLLLHCPNQKRRTDTRSGTNNFSSANGESLNGEPASLALSYHQPAIPNPGSSKAQILNRSASVTKWVRSDQITVICLLFFFGFCLLVRKRQHHFPGCLSGHHFLAPASLTSCRRQHHFCSCSYQPPTATPDHGSPNSNAISFSFFLQVFPRLVSWNYSQLRSMSKCIIDYVYSY